MAILLTNGKYYIAHNRTGAVIKVSDIEQAQDFYSVGRAINQRNRTPGKCAGYYYINTEKYKAKIKRKIILMKNGKSYTINLVDGASYVASGYYLRI